MKIALIAYDFAEYCVQCANGLARESDVLLMLPEDDMQQYAAQLDPAVELHPFVKPRLRQPVRQLMSVCQLVRQIRKFRPDVVHLQHGHLWFNTVLPLLRSYPLVVTIHDPRHHLGDRSSRKTPQAVMDFGFRRADRVIVHGQQLKRQMVDEVGIASGRIHVIPHVAIGQTNTRPASERASNVILFFGRIWDYKGLDYLIQAEPLIAREVPDVRIVVAGQGDDMARYRRQMVHPERFTVHDEFVSDTKRAELFAEASVVVLPYVEATQSGVIPVAYSFAKPVVATAVGALPEIVEHGRTGLLVPPRDPVALANAVVELLGDPDLCRTMGAAGRDKLNTECAPDVIARQTLAVYRQAVGDRRGQAEHRRVAAGTPIEQPFPSRHDDRHVPSAK